MPLPVIRETPLRKTDRGYVRQLGPAGKGKGVFKFYLGHDSAEAAKRRQLIEKIYIENCRLSGYQHWQSDYLDVAKQVAKTGEAVYRIEPVDDPIMHRHYRSIGGRDFTWLARLREQGVPICVVGETHEAKATVTLPEAVTERNKPCTVKLHAALDRYQEQRASSYVGGYQGRERVRKQIVEIKKSVADCWLARFTFPDIKEHVDHWRSRPTTARGTRTAKSYCENQIGEFYRFLNWADSTYPEFNLPNLASIDRRVPKIASDVKGNAIEDKQWKPAELREIFKTAQPLTQLILGMGLNCCSGAAELGRIRTNDILFDSEHPCANVIRYHERGTFLVTTRRKGWTHSEALIWPWLVPLVKEQVERCKANAWTYLFTENGEPLYRDNPIYAELGLELPKTTKPESRFVKRYNNAVSLAFDKKRITRKLSLGKLRKTFSDYLTNENHADLGSLALSHVTSEDELLKHYANKPYRRLFEFTLKHADYWKLSPS